VYGGCVIAETTTATFAVNFMTPTVWGCGEGKVQPTPPSQGKKDTDEGIILVD